MEKNFSTPEYPLLLRNSPYLFHELRQAFIWAIGIFVLLFLGVSTFAALTKDTPPAQSGLTGGAFMYWMQEVLLPNTLPVKNGKYSVSTELSNPTVKKSRRIADTNGNIIVTGHDGKVGIGTQTPSELLEIQGDTPRMLISSVQNNPSLKLVANNKSGTVYFDRAARELVFAKGNDDSFLVDEDGKVHVVGDVKEQGVVVVTADQLCETNGTYVYEFDESGKIKCK